MGREARGTVPSPDGPVAVRLHLDGQALEVRAGLRRRFPREEIESADADGSTLRVRAAGEDLRIEVDDAPAWARAILTPPPSLAHKLGLGAGVRALVVGDAPEPVRSALDGCTTDDPAAAGVVLATVTTPDELAALPCSPAGGLGVPVWVVHGKGRASAPGASAVREVMRAAGFRDTLVTGVDEAWSATRYHA